MIAPWEPLKAPSRIVTSSPGSNATFGRILSFFDSTWSKMASISLCASGTGFSPPRKPITPGVSRMKRQQAGISFRSSS